MNILDFCDVAAPHSQRTTNGCLLIHQVSLNWTKKT